MYPVVFERVLLTHVCTLTEAMCVTIRRGERGRKTANKITQGAQKASSRRIVFSRGFSLKVVASRAFSRSRAVPSAPSSVKALRYAPPAAAALARP